MGSRIAGERYRNEGRPSELKRLGYKDTPCGPIDPFTVRGFETLRIAGLRAIDNCQNHTGRGCACYASVREALWQVQSRFADSMPERWMAQRLIEELNSYRQLKPGDYGNGLRLDNASD